MTGGFKSGFSKETRFDMTDTIFEAFLFFLESVMVFLKFVKTVLLAGGSETEE